MKKKGFTFIETMIAITVFAVLAILVVRLNITANRNISTQADRQNMMMEAQKLMEKTKTTTVGIGTYVDENSPLNDFKQVDGYYAVVQVKNVGSQGPPTLLEVTIIVRRDAMDKNNQVVLKSHFLKN